MKKILSFLLTLALVAACCTIGVAESTAPITDK